jgi:ABC-type transport system involved in cytochrome c biogenesis ATPase subunit
MSAAIVMPMANQIACRALTIRSGGRTVIRDFTWSHTPPGIVWVTGSNGSGKSSLLQVVAGWRRPASGDAVWTSDARARLRYYAPSMQAPPALRVREFLAFVEQRNHKPNSLTGIYPAPVSDHALFGKLSTGESKRLLLWALLGHGDGPLVLDEPYEHLSRDVKSLLTTILQQRAQQQIVVVATNQDVPPGVHDCTLDVGDEQVQVQRAN